MINQIKKQQKIDDDISDKEILMMGLRLNKGIELKKIKNKNFLRTKEMSLLINKGIIFITGDKLKINEHFFKVHNSIVSRIIDNY